MTFAAGLPSAEGPAVSASAHSYSMRTYAPLQITDVRCWQTPCRPGDAVEIAFNNELDASAFDPDGLTIEPAVTGRTVSQFGNVVTVQGAWLANSTYQVTVPPPRSPTYTARRSAHRTPARWRSARRGRCCGPSTTSS